MVLVGFLLTSTALNLVFGFLLQFKAYRKSLRATLLALSVLFTAQIWAAYAALSSIDAAHWFAMHRFLLALDAGVALGVLELARRFLRDGDSGPATWRWGGAKISLVTLAWIGSCLAILLGFLPGGMVPGTLAPDQRVIFQGAGLLIPAVRTLVAIYILFLLESTYRFAADYQRRIGRLCFIGMALIAIFHLIIFARALLYRYLPAHFAEAFSVIYGVVYPVVLAGFFRYRLGSERVSVSRESVYTSATIFLTGAAFLGVAVSIFVFRWLRLDFNYFERFLVGFSLCFLAVLVLGSGSMRRRISRFVNEQFYARKYDYQDQFFRLHKTSASGALVDGALTELVENMKYSVSVDDAYCFLLDWRDGNFYQHENKEEGTLRGLVLDGDCGLARMLARTPDALDLLAGDAEREPLRRAARAEPLIEKLAIDAVFPIFIGDRFAGMLALKGGRHAPFDKEDLDLIAVFTNSIGDALFKNRILKERIEQKQFESFHHVASFIIHDIKNQIATLTLLLKNAESNLGNPSFQASMLNSVKSCSDNLQGLIDRLAVAPKGESLELATHALRPLLGEVVANSGLEALSDLAFSLEGEPSEACMDRKALFFVIRNLIANSLEAMRWREGGPAPARLSLSYGPLGGAAAPRLREVFGGGERFFSGYEAYIAVSDNGSGMDPDFVRHRLFQPFATTKEKGVGIGLYQCKTLVEKMGGRILCHSEPGQGTEFCILLAAAPCEDTSLPKDPSV